MYRRYKCMNSYIMRGPTFPIEKLEETFQTYGKKKDEIIIDEVLAEGLESATHNLITELNKNKRNQDIESTLLKYIIRSTTRATPYGLLSGISAGEFAKNTDVIREDVIENKKRCRVDMGWLCSFISNLEKNEKVLVKISVKFNEQCIIKGDRIYNPYITSETQEDEQNLYTAVSIRLSEILLWIKQECSTSIVVKDLVEKIIAKKAMDRRGEKEFDLDAVVALDDKRRELLKEVEVMKNELNVESKKIPQLIKEGKDVDAAKAQLKELSDKIKAIDEQVRTVEGEMEYNLMRIPNVPHPDVPQGTTDEDNVEIRQWGETPKFDFEGKAHWDIGTGLGILDFETAGKITGSRFTLYKGLGARLERAIINFFLNTHTEEHGYTEVLPPFMANRTSFIGTGQLPKFEEDMFKIEGSAGENIGSWK